MPRATNIPQSRRRRKKILKAAKGFRGGNRRLLKTATVAVMRSRQYAYRDRKKRKGDFRSLHSLPTGGKKRVRRWRTPG